MRDSDGEWRGAFELPVLDFAKTGRKPIRLALVELVSSDDDAVLTSTHSAMDGTPRTRVLTSTQRCIQFAAKHSAPTDHRNAICVRLRDGLAKTAAPHEARMGEYALANIRYKLYKPPGIGFVPMYRTMLTEQKNTSAMNSVFSFFTGLRAHLDKAGLAQLDTILASIGLPAVDQLDEWGTNQVVPKGVAIPREASRAVLPIYNKLVNGTAIACTTAAFGKKKTSFAISPTCEFQFRSPASIESPSRPWDLIARRISRLPERAFAASS